VSIELVDVEAALRGLKDFQCRTVEYVFNRLYRDSRPTMRFLVADEVGLGKTLVARGIIAKTIQHLQQHGKNRIDILYICSNATIAHQNLNRLNVTAQESSSFATRLTLLPLQLQSLKANGINFISFTPGTTFDLRSRGGKVEERALIYRMLRNHFDIRSTPLLNLLQGKVARDRWIRCAKHEEFDYDESLAESFRNHIQSDRQFFGKLLHVCHDFKRVKRVRGELVQRRYKMIGELRRRLADVCIEALEPDLVMEGKLNLGRMPDDLADVLADFALASPAICALRALRRITASLPKISPLELSAAARIGEGLRSLFNQPEVTALVRADEERLPYWRRVLNYGIDGNLQAVLDEYAHVLKDITGLASRPDPEIVNGVCNSMVEALSLHTSSLRVDDLKATSQGHIRLKEFSIRCHFAVRFGDVRDDEGKTLVRSGNVRQAFNSPFRPFVLASTSVGQEGLDFHPYCHVVYHWNLPSNPVDMEQREGRVHRYKGHAVRRNIAKAYGLAGLRGGDWTDPWEKLFKRAADDRPQGMNDLVPYWLFETQGGYSVERRVPLLPLSREVPQLSRLKQMLAVYRLAFGQPRQEDLLAYLSHYGIGTASQGASISYRISLAPTECGSSNPPGTPERASGGLDSD
jgi:hypothetical protein